MADFFDSDEETTKKPKVKNERLDGKPERKGK
jgi:hypothetical protein